MENFEQANLDETVSPLTAEERKIAMRFLAIDPRTGLAGAYNNAPMRVYYLVDDADRMIEAPNFIRDMYAEHKELVDEKTGESLNATHIPGYEEYFRDLLQEKGVSGLSQERSKEVAKEVLNIILTESDAKKIGQVDLLAKELEIAVGNFGNQDDVVVQASVLNAKTTLNKLLAYLEWKQ